ncbi:MAG: EAL domain-containing protein [Methylococcales bacterium]|nr:EAL domain-containing protein [Methylococcales bacterium]
MTTEEQRQRALEALRSGDFDFALTAIQCGEASIGEMVEDLKIYQAELEIQNEELRESQVRLEQVRRRFSDLFMALPQPALVIDKQGVIQESNLEAERRFGLRRYELRSHFLPRLVHKQDHARLSSFIGLAFADGLGMIHQIGMLSADRQVFFANAHAQLLTVGPDEPPQLIVTILDQTEQMAQRSALDAGRRKFQAYFTEAPVGMATVDLDKTWLEANDKLCELLGYNQAELRGLTWLDVTHPMDRSRELKTYQQVMRYQREDYQLDKRFVRSDGSLLEAHVAVAAVRTAEGHLDYLIKIVEDISQRKRVERERDLLIERNQALLQLTTQAPGQTEVELLRFALQQAERLTRSGIAYVHFVNDDQETLTLGVWSQQTLAQCQVVSDSHYPLSEAGVWADCVRQRQTVIHNDYHKLANKKGLPEGHVPLSRHISTPVLDHERVFMIMGVGNKVEPYNDGDKVLLEMLANNTWALLQRNRSQRLLELHSQVFRQSQEAVMITDADRRIISVNEAFTKITGYRAEEVLGKDPRLLKSGQHSAAFYQTMWQQLEESGYWQGEIWNRRKDGRLYPEWLGISVIHDKNGKITEYIAVFSDISDYKNAQQRIEHLAHHDPLTGLPNRLLLRDRFQQTIAHAKRHNGITGLLYLDLDHFKNINDTMGHPAGDRLLLETAQRLRGCIRSSDTVSRIGGDEFIVLLSHLHSEANLIEIAGKILHALAQPYELEFNQFTVSCSMGISIYPDDGEDFDSLLQKADTALYQAKNRGRNNYQFFTDEMNQRLARQMRLDSYMRQGLDLGQFYLAYQPQIELATGDVLGVEALLRWHHPKLGQVGPAEFIGVAEDSGFIIELGEFVLRCACRQARLWLDLGVPLTMAVNVSYVQFNRVDLRPVIEHCLQESGLPPHYLELELTESILAADPDKVLDVVQGLQRQGVRFAVDDFGTGYSSLSYLKRFAVDKLKIDQSFVMDVPSDSENVAIVETIINLSNNLAMQCIAEGVETESQATFLQSLGCQQAQGYWFAKPMSAEQIEAFVRQQRQSKPAS